jgi:hypothetical protein
MRVHKLSTKCRLGLAIAGQGALLLGVLLLGETDSAGTAGVMTIAALASAALVWWMAHGMRAALARTVFLAATAAGADAARDAATASLRRAIDRADMPPASGCDPQRQRG